ncbi:hypothetical protein CspHIS471_0411080 [Cutaneotrichosporon sp. HIS471]|nr:hypothetical protein CspHIS471_0411080 [Cutaneotrichosporon sp. HIS471]
MDHHSHMSVHTAPTSPDSKANSPSEGGFKPKLRVVERGSQACNECRRHKIRCHPAPDDPDHHKACARCVRMQLECVFKKHNRGRKRKNLHPTDSPAESPTAKHSHHEPRSSHAHPAASGYYNNRGGSPERTLMSGVGRYPFIAVDQHLDMGPGAGPSRLPQPGSADSSLKRMVDVWEADDEDDGYSETSAIRHAPRPEPPRSREYVERSPRAEFMRELRPTGTAGSVGPANGHRGADEPVAVNLITVEEGRIFFDLFVKHFNRAMAIIDPVIHTHDYVRQTSPFLYTVIMCIGSRYLDQVGQEPLAISHNDVHRDIVVMAQNHLMWAFAEALCRVDVVQAIVALTLWKEPDDDKAAFYFNRAVVLAQELRLSDNPPPHILDTMTDSERREVRHRQRLWMTLFSINSIFHMQFRQPMLIPTTDPLITTNHFWLKRGYTENVVADTWVVFSVDLRRRYLQYRERLTDAATNPLVLSTITKTLNEEWNAYLEAWIHEILQVGGHPSIVHKPRVWYASLALNLNLTILHHTLRIPPSDRLPPPPPGPPRLQMRSIPAFDYCLNAATTVLFRFNDLEKEQLTYASDTLLHFALYAATFLWTLCRNPELYEFDQAEVEHTRNTILSVAEGLDSASAYPGSSPALHARYLRRLVRTGTYSQGSFDEAGADASAATDREGLMPPLVPFDSQYGGPIPAPGQTPATAMGELDIILSGSYPWNMPVGMDPGWIGPGSAPQVDPALFDQGGGSVPMTQQEGSAYTNGSRRLASPPLPLHGGHA